MEIPLKQLKQLLKTLEDGGASEFEFEDEKYRIRVSMARGAHQEGTQFVREASVSLRPSVSAAPEPVAVEADDGGLFVTSPFVGTFYRASSPEGEPFVSPGSTASPGQTLCIVEAMKLMNEIEAEFACTILDVLVENGKSVEFGQKLFRVKRL